MNKITIIPVGGLCNRLRVINSAFLLFNNKNVEVEIIWLRDKGMGCAFDKLFEPILSSNIIIKEGRLLDNIMYVRPRKGNLWLPLLWQTWWFQKTIFENRVLKLLNEKYSFDALMNYKKSLLSTFHRFSDGDQKYNCFVPLTDLKEKIRETSSEFVNNTIGVHVRRF